MAEQQRERSAFALPERLRGKAAAALIGDDERQFARIAETTARESAATQERLVALRRAPGRAGQHALERDLEIARLSARVRLLGRFGLDVCIGRMTASDGTCTYIGRAGLADADGARLLVDWRAPAAEPFFAATHGHPAGLASRRRYRWAHGRIVDYWDEVFAPDGVDHTAALDDQSAFIASLGVSRSPRMRDVLATIQSDQDAIIRAGSDGALVVDGGPGTGKTVVALHRAAYLLYADPRLAPGRGRLLFIGPHRPYLDYVEDVLPGLGEEGAVLTTLAGLVPLVPEGTAVPEHDPLVRAVKGRARLADAVEAAVSLWERPPQSATTLETPWGAMRVGAREWREIFAAVDESLPHNSVHGDAWERLLDLLAERIEDEENGGRVDAWAEGWGDATPDAREADFDAYGLRTHTDVRARLEQHLELREAFDRLWPLLDPAAVVRGLWRSRPLLARCAPWLDDAELDVLTRDADGPWTDADLPLLDAAWLRVGDPRDEVRRRRERDAAAADREIMSDVVDHLVAADDGDLRIMSMLRGQDLRQTLDTGRDADRDPLAGVFAHVVVDEAQELTDAEWAMVLRRCSGASLTIVGDRAQARAGFAEPWTDRLRRIGLDRFHVAELTVNYRTPAEVMSVAEPVIRAAIPDANVPRAIRRSGFPVRRGAASDLDHVVDEWLARNDEGTAVVIGADRGRERERVRWLDPVTVKGMEFDLVVLVRPAAFGAGLRGAVDRYVAMTRATRELVVLGEDE